VEDNGVGMRQREEGYVGNGLKGIRERLEFVNGSLRIESGEGVKLLIRVPIVIK